MARSIKEFPLEILKRNGDLSKNLQKYHHDIKNYKATTGKIVKEN